MKFRALLRLARIPNVFTAFANVLAGVSLARAGVFTRDDFALAGASGALYTAGMIWNDYYDRFVDAQERPDRPIPSGEISPPAAAAIGGVLLAFGLALAAWHGGWALIVAFLLAATILLYDAWLKITWFGPIAMGLCRTLNVALGLCASLRFEVWLWLLPLLLGVFTVLITQLSRFEVAGTVPERLNWTVSGLGSLGLAVLPALIWVAIETRTPALSLCVALAAYGFLLWRGQRLFAPLRREVSPPLLGRAIGGGILLMPALDAAFIAASGSPLLAAAAFALAGPAYLLKRWYYLT